jgi:hypothetical protein
MNTVRQLSIPTVLLVSFIAAVPAAAQGTDTQPAVTLPASGTFARGGEFTGTVTINRFEQRAGRIVAVGFVRGALQQGGRTIGSALAGEVSWPVVVRSGGVSSVSGHGGARPQVMRVALSTAPSAGRILRVQAATCPVLDIMLAPVDVNLLGVDVSISPIAINLQGEAGTPLGDLVCTASDLIGNVVALVDLLNTVLELVTGLLGGILGGVGGGAPPVG